MSLPISNPCDQALFIANIHEGARPNCGIRGCSGIKITKLVANKRNSNITLGIDILLARIVVFFYAK